MLLPGTSSSLLLNGEVRSESWESALGHRVYLHRAQQVVSFQPSSASVHPKSGSKCLLIVKQTNSDLKSKVFVINKHFVTTVQRVSFSLLLGMVSLLRGSVYSNTLSLLALQKDPLLFLIQGGAVLSSSQHNPAVFSSAPAPPLSCTSLGRLIYGSLPVTPLLSTELWK